MSCIPVTLGTWKFLGWEQSPLRWTKVLVIAKCHFLLRDAEFAQSCELHLPSSYPAFRHFMRTACEPDELHYGDQVGTCPEHCGRDWLDRSRHLPRWAKQALFSGRGAGVCPEGHYAQSRLRPRGEEVPGVQELRLAWELGVAR